MIKKGLNVALMGVLGLAIVGCDGQQKKTSETKESINITKNMEQAVYTKKFTNKDFYKDGKFQGDVALKAYEDMLSFYGIQLSDFMRKNLWITDFELGDFEHVGMAGFFWVNDAEHGYFAHEIYLLPGQMITEHRHVATDHPAKHESWMVNKGFVYNFSTGEETPNCPKLPECQNGFITAKHFVKQNPGETLPLNGIGEPHFMMAGENGACVFEFANYHDGNGLRFTNPKVQFTDVLSQK